MAVNFRHPLVKRPLMMAGIEGGAILLLVSVAGETDFMKALTTALMAAAIAAVAGLFIGFVEISGGDKARYKPPKKKLKKTPAPADLDKTEAAGPGSSAVAEGDASRTKSWSPRCSAKSAGNRLKQSESVSPAWSTRKQVPL